MHHVIPNTCARNAALASTSARGPRTRKSCSSSAGAAAVAARVCHGVG